MDAENDRPEFDARIKLQWKRIKRNGYFAKKKRNKTRLIESGVSTFCTSIHTSDPESLDEDCEEVSGNIVSGNSSSSDELQKDKKQHMGLNDSGTDMVNECTWEVNASNASKETKIKTDFRNWALKNQIRHSHVNDLLKIFRDNNLDLGLPNDARTLLKTPRVTQVQLSAETNESYWHYGVQRAVELVLQGQRNLKTKYKLNINIDGLPMFKSSKLQFWPILLQIHELRENTPPLIVGVFAGKAKPTDVNVFLEPVVRDLNLLLEYGLVINKKAINFKVRCFICDTPARSMLRGTKGHGGYFSCLKCVTEGEYSYEAGVVIYPQTNAKLRTDADFRSKIDEEHHNYHSILEDIIGLDMIKDFPIGDALHLIDLGVMKRFLLGWKSGKLGNYNAKWSADQILCISKFLIRNKLPREFNRPFRGLDEISFWKGAEFRSFLFYASIVVVREYFNIQGIYEHFLNFFCAIVICARYDQCSENYQVARLMLLDFLAGIKKIYSSNLYCSNIHSLCHLVDDVERFGPLDTFSAYPFESRLSTLKSLIRSGKMPLSQLANRISEMQHNLSLTKNTDNSPTFGKKCRDFYILDDNLRSFIELTNYELYLYVKFKKSCIDTGRDSDKWILTTDFKIFCLEYIIRNPNNDNILLFGFALKETKDYFVRPVRSSSLHIYHSNMETKQDSEIFPINRFYSKMVKIESFDKATGVFIPLIHTLV